MTKEKEREKECKQCGKKHSHSTVDICDDCIKKLNTDFFVGLDFLKNKRVNNEIK